MTTTQHTPGPWTADWCIRDNADLETARGWHVYAGNPNVNGEPPICDIPDGSRLDGARVANARLIAAAPDLLAACREAEVLLAKLVEMNRIPANNAAMRMARAAIAKATA